MPRKDEGAKELVLASWRDRFFAWVIDFLIIVFIVEAVTVLAVGVLGGNAFRLGMSELFVTFSFLNLAFFVYWTYMESTRGRSIGKTVLKLMVVTKSGEPIDLTKSAIQSFGKVFLLPIDVILGYLLFQEHRQRLFSKLAETVVIKLQVEEPVKDVKYVKD